MITQLIRASEAPIALIENWLKPFLLLGIRLYIFYVFFRSGLTKLADWDTTLALFTDEYHVPLLPPALAAVMGAGGELLLSPLFALGIASRFAAVGLFVVNLMAPPVVLTSVELTAESVGEAGRAGRTLTHPDLDASVRLGPGRTSITVRFAALDFTAPARNRYRYIMEGYDDAWHETGADDRRATYETRFLDHMMSISSAVVIVCYTMFTIWPTTVAVHGNGDLIYTVPFVIYGVFRYQWAIYHGGTSGDPGDFVWRDRPLMAAIVLWGLSCVAFVYGG